MNADQVFDMIFDALNGSINKNRRNIFITPEQRKPLVAAIEAAEREAYNKAIADAAQALAQEQTEMPVSRHDAEENQVLDRAIEIVNALTK